MAGPVSREIDGIRVVANGGRHGSCVSYHNFDLLDRKAAAFVQEFCVPRDLPAVDAGCSQYAVQALRFAGMGARVDAFDLLTPVCELPPAVRFFGGDIRAADTARLHPLYGAFYAQRLFDLFPFADVKAVLAVFAARLVPGGRMFFSVASLTGPHGQGYADRDKPVEDRFCLLEEAQRREHDLLTPVCLYAEDDFEILKAGLPLRIVERFTSRSIYKTHKIVFEKE